MANEISVNTSTARKFLIGTGLRASKEGVQKFQELLNKTAQELADKAAEKAKGSGKKTIMPEDLE